MIEFNLPFVFECKLYIKDSFGGIRYCEKGELRSFTGGNYIRFLEPCEKCCGTGKIQLEKLELDKTK